MSDGRKALLVNRYETITDQQLREASSRHGLRVCPKVGVAEVLNIQYSGITSEEYTYALKANFDFVVATDNDVAYPLFAVEFDEPHHRTDPKTIRRDRMKNALCERFRLPLLRIDEGWLRPIRQWTVLRWIIEVQGLYDAWRQEQEEGRIPWEEDFYWPLIFDVDGQGRLVDRPYDLALEAIRALHEACARGVTTTLVEQQISHEDEHGYMVCYGVLPLAAGGYIIEQGRCWSFHFRPVTPRDLAQDLATIAVAEALRRHESGGYVPHSEEQLAALRARTEGWRVEGAVFSE
jgi:Protein of unknown function (DUF2726)